MAAKTIPLIFCSVLIFEIASGQCTITIPDTVCPLQNITLYQPGSLSVDFCSGRLDSLNGISSLGLGPYQFKLVKENNSYYVFYPEYATVHTARYEVNSSLTTILNGINIVAGGNDSCATSFAYEMVKVDAAKWVAFKADYFSSNLFKISFDSISDNDPAFEFVGNYGISSPYYLKAYENYLFVTNGNNTVSKIHFDNNFQNVLDSSVITGNFSSPVGIDIIYDCGTSAYYGFVANLGGSVSRIDFGNTLSNNSPQVFSMTTAVGGVRGLKMYNEKNEWYCFLNTYSSGNLQLLKLGAADNLNAIKVLDTSIAFVPYGLDILVDSSAAHVFTSSGGNMVQVLFKKCNSGNSWLSGNDSLNFNFQPSDTGYQYFQLASVDSNHNAYYVYDSLYVSIPPPEAFFTTSGTCEGQPVLFNNLSSVCYGNITTYQWSFGDSNSGTDQNPVHSYASGGSYTVTLTVYAANGDSGIYSKNITVVPLPVANFTSTDTVCSGYALQFTDISTAANDSIVTWLWNFDDNTSAFVQHPSHAFSTDGTFNVKLVVINSNGCADSIVKPVTVLSTPVADFSASGTCVGGTVYFENLTDSGTNAIVNYWWQFGDSNSSTAAFPGNNYPNNPATYLVQLQATALNGCSTAYSDSIHISNPPLVSFTASTDTVCKNVPVTFINTSTTQNNDSVISKTWYFSDGTVIQNADTVFHSFAGSGTAGVSLTVITPTYCDSTVGMSVWVLDNPTANFTFTNVCYGDSNKLNDSSIAVPGDMISSYVWNFGDGSPFANGTSNSHLYDSAGVFNVMLTVTSVNGCADSIVKPVEVYKIPIANFLTPQTLCSDSAASFTDYSIIFSGDSVAFWNWTFGDAGSSSLQNPVHSYAQPGNYSITLIILTQNGCIDLVTKTDSVYLSPSPSFSYDSTCHGEQTHFTYINLSGSIAAYSWNFGELGSGNATLQNPSHPYLYPGTYTVTVTATDINQCFAGYSQTVTIHPRPIVGFTISNPCELSATLFTDTSAASPDQVVQWKWLVNDSSFATTPAADYTFSAAGSYLVELIATSNFGCTDSIIRPVTIYPKPDAGFTISPPYATPNQTVTFNNNSQNASTYTWIFSDGFNSTAASPTHSFKDTSDYTITLIAVSNKGCIDTAYASFSVLIPVLEVAVTDVSYQLQNGLLALSAQLINLGNIPINNYRMVANVDGAPSLIEFSAQLMKVGDPPFNFAFKSKLEISETFSPSYFCIEVQKPNGIDDGILANNIKCKAIAAEFDILSITPNPAHDNLQLYISSPFEQSVTLKIFDIQSKLLYDKSFHVKKGFNAVNIQTGNFSKGLYFIWLSNESTSIKSSFVKQ